MSRLDSFIRRLQAQRACLDFALANLVPGAIVELGLGNGRTFDHIRERFGGSRTIYALDRQLAAHPDCIPRELLLGEFHDTLPALVRRIGRAVALVHADTGSGDAAASRGAARALPALLEPLLVDGALIVSDQDMAPGWQTLALPEGVTPGRYFIWRRSESRLP
ncbi:MAG TPA: class I SAM-dependent methyltransferase [Burkholderiales bacterium]|nr:class I SAM-dependent methyltransferase [Burkholderiales bacterium]